MSNDGKRFEKNFEDSIKQYNEKFKSEDELRENGISYIRLFDPGHGFGGVGNICDYVLYSKPNIIFLELKSRKGNRINLSEALTKTQYEGLVEQSKIKGAIPGVLIKFRDYDLVYFIHIDNIDKHRDVVIRGKDKGKPRWSYRINNEKSITPEMANECGVILMGNKKRVNWDYNVIDMIKMLKNKYGN